MSYFDKFPEKATPGIPNVEMNAPVFSGRVPKGDVGIELEIEATNYMPEAKDILVRDEKTGGYWVNKADGSLRGGMEYVASTPFSIESVPMMVAGLYEAISKHKTKLKLSNRCSTHVHLNISDWKVDKITSLIVLWTLFEVPLINWCGVNRKTNHFCLSTVDSDDLVVNWDGFLKDGRSLFHEGSKYTALNLLPLFTQGSAEVRVGREPWGPADVLPWVQFLWALRNYAFSIENPGMIPAIVSEGGPGAIFDEICSGASLQSFRDEVFARTSDFNSASYLAFRESQKLCYHPWDDWLPMIQREHYKNPFGKKAAIKIPRIPDQPPPQPAPRIRLGGAVGAINNDLARFIDDIERRN